MLAHWWKSGWLVPLAWPALFVLGAVVMTRRVAAEWSVTDRAVWLEITPPTRMPVDGAAGLWRVGARRRELRSGYRGHPAIRRAWPGAQVRLTYPPTWYYPPAVAELCPAARRSSPLIDLTARPAVPYAPRSVCRNY